MNQCPRCLKQFRTVFGDAEMLEFVHTCTPTKEWREMEEATEKSSKEIARLNALVAMQAEALKFYADCRHFVQHQDVWELVIGEPISFFENNTAAIEDGSTAKQALSASSPTVAKWEAEKLLPLQRQVAMLRSCLDLYPQHFHDVFNPESECEICTARKDTQATAEAYDREHAAKVLEPIGKVLHYPVCWDTAAYPTLLDAITEISHCTVCEDPEAHGVVRATKQVKE